MVRRGLQERILYGIMNVEREVEGPEGWRLFLVSCYVSVVRINDLYFSGSIWLYLLFAMG